MALPLPPFFADAHGGMTKELDALSPEEMTDAQHKSVFIGDARLPDFRKLLVSNGIEVGCPASVLACNDPPAVPRADDPSSPARPPLGRVLRRQACVQWTHCRAQGSGGLDYRRPSVLRLLSRPLPPLFAVCVCLSGAVCMFAVARSTLLAFKRQFNFFNSDGIDPSGDASGIFSKNKRRCKEEL